MVSLDGVGADRLAAWKADVDLGDHVGVTGEVISSRRGELSVLASDWVLTSKALRPLPDKHHGLTDPELRIRQRYVDLVVNPDSRRMVHDRAAVVRAVRDVLHGHGFVEVETPVLQMVHGGAAARPFATHLNALDLDMTLRIALELYLKRLVVGGVDRVFEIGRIFRNEGVDSHPLARVHDARVLRGLRRLRHRRREDPRDGARGGPRAPAAPSCPTGRAARSTSSSRGAAPPCTGWCREAVGEPVDAGTPLEHVVALADEHDVALQEGWDAGEVVLELYEKLVEHTLLQPTFVKDYPVSARPLARDHRDDPRLAEAWDLVVAGTELATGYSELVDPVEQRRRLTEQSIKAAGGDPEAMQLDEDFLLALEHGAPPMGGQGMGIDRLVMLLTGAPIRETILFPLVRPLG